MTDDPRIQQLLDELLASDATPEAVCASCPELLPVVRQRQRRIRRLDADLDVVFPPPAERAMFLKGGELPRIPGYEVEAVLGRGGMGVVFRARHVPLNRIVALKMLLPGAYAASYERARFQREAEAVAGLRHANIVQVHDVGDVDGQPYFTMEYVEGGSLALKLAGAPQPSRQAAELVALLGSAIQAAHECGIVHRDLKPANVLLAADGTPKVTDFGLARRQDDGAGLTQSGVAVGTPSYMAPEQAKGRPNAIGPAVDIYALGAILYELLTGRPPFRAATAAETVQQVIFQEPAPLSRLNAQVPRDLETICLKCLQKEPGQRYASAAELARDLDRYVRGEPIAARPVSRTERIFRWARRKPTAAALIVTATTLIGLASAIGANQWRRETKRRAEINKWSSRLELVQQLQRKSQLQEARELLRRLPDADLGELNDRVRTTLAELDLALTLERIRSNRAAVVDGRYDPDANRARSDREYEATLAKAGIGGFWEDPSVVAARIQASPIQTALVAALDDWVLCTNDEGRQRWVFRVAQLADSVRSDWRDRVRTPPLARDALMELATSAVPADHSVQLLVALAQRLKAAGGDATAFLGRVQQQYPGDFWSCFTLAEVLWDKKRADSIRYYQAALAIRPDAAIAHLNVGRALAKGGRIDEAIEHYREAMRLEPAYANAVSSLGLSLNVKGQLDEAIDSCRRAIELDEASAENHVRLGFVFSTRGRYEEAIESYRRALAIDSRDLPTHLYLGFCFLKLGSFDKAMQEYQLAQRIDPKAHSPHLEMGQLLRHQGKMDDAIGEFEIALQLKSDDVGLYFYLAECWRQKQSLEKALVAYNKALALQPDHADSIRGRRFVWVQLGHLEAARLDWAKILKERPIAFVDWSGYAELCLYEGRQTEYEEACHKLLERFESSNEPRVWERVGRTCLLGPAYADDMARGAQLIERALQADLPLADAWARKYFRVAHGLARYRLGDFEGSIRAIDAEAAEVLGPLPHLVLSMAHRRAGHADDAYRSLATAVSVFDWSPSRATDPDAWLYHVLRREAERLVMPNLAALLAGRDLPRDGNELLALIAVCQASDRTAMAARLLASVNEPRNNDDRLAQIAVCMSMKRIARAASLYADAFDADPGFGNAPGSARRYNAACCAARAASGDGEDARDLSDLRRTSLRKYAGVWLRDDLVAKRAHLTGDPSAYRIALPGQLEIWLTTPALAGVRDDAKLRMLPQAEQEAWRALWRDVKSLHTEATTAVSKVSR